MAKKYTTEVYAKAREVLVNQAYEADWQKFLTETCRVKSLLGSDGFNASDNDGIDKLRGKIAADAKAGGGAGAVLIKAAKNGTTAGSMQERAAALKMLRHTYLVNQSGGQQVWVYAPPKDHASWIFEEIVGSPEVIEPKLGADTEIFSRTEMEWMSSALKLSLKISEDTRVLLGAKSDATAKVVKRWFLDENAGDTELADAFARLAAGFQKISGVCGSNRLVFTDYADWRAERDKYFGAAFRGGEGGGFPVIYLEGAFTRLTGNTGKQWLCVETIIHEFSHHEVRTRDHRYDSSGLQPRKDLFPYAKAIDNADSWGYFALDLAGYLSDSDRSKTLK
jgi:hypothetical protein